MNYGADTAWKNGRRSSASAGASGLSNRELCRQNGIPEKTFYYRLRKLREKDAAAEREMTLALLFRDYRVRYGVFSKSGFKARLLDAARENTDVALVNETAVATFK